jgi:acyl transferase domain-containing protein/SAM-dependent methyltransferase
MQNDEAEQLSPVKRALLEVRELRARLDRAEHTQRQPVAIVGIGCRFPGNVRTPDAFWGLLHDGVDAITEVPRDRWDIDVYYDANPDASGRMCTRFGGFVDEVDRFDPYFFGITPREAAAMDPQQRLLLEVAWEALEHAALAPEKLAGTDTGVFVGISIDDYAHLQTKANDPSRLDSYFASGSAHSVAAGRISYLLGLRGPSLAVDTACSSSLVAVHLACQSLRAGECRTALAGGVNVILTPDNSVGLSRARMMALDGRCKTFDAAADGYVRSDGCGIVVLKRLSDAIADGDRVLAVIRGTAVNQDGRTSGLTVPNGPAQEALIARALGAAGIAPADVHYVEAHGTGTSLGDPIEVQALASAYGSGRTADRPLLVGSVKSNIGHLESAAGVAGLIKVVLALQHGEIPASLHFREPNPHIPWGQVPVSVVSAPRPWPDGPRIAGVSSFGFSGTNAHAVVEEAPVRPDPAEPAVDRPSHVLALSAQTPSALEALAARYATSLATGEPSIGDVCHTANAGRSHFPHRAAILADSLDQLRDRLEAVSKSQASDGIAIGKAAPNGAAEIAFLYTGQGAQYAGMGRRLYDAQPTFRRAIDRCAELLQPHIGRPLTSILFDDDGALDSTAWAQPALFSLEYALTQLWRSWGIEPSIVLGHSLGEYVAACVAGVFGLEDALRLVATRGRLMNATAADGAMAAVFADPDRVAAATAPYAERVAIAAINGPEETVISGPRDLVATITASLEAAGVRTQSLATSRAFHSPAMDPVLDEFEGEARALAYHAPEIPIVANATGEFAGGDTMANASYWRRQLREPVRFHQSLAALFTRGCPILVEIGPAPVLLGLAQRSASSTQPLRLPSLRKGRDDWSEILASLASLYAAGVRVDWAGFDRDYRRSKIALPTYPFERTRCWIEEVATRPGPRVTAFAHARSEAERQADTGPLDLSVTTFGDKWAYLDRLTAAFITNAFVSLGAFTRPGDRYAVDDLLRLFQIRPLYARLIARWCRCLEGAGVLRRDGDHFVADSPLVTVAAEPVPGEGDRLFADYPALLDYTRRSGESLADMATNRQSPIDLLFPGGSYDTADELYSRSVVPRYLNGIVRGVVSTFVNSSRRPDALRVLEIGAGTGGTTAALLPALASHEPEYWFTDVTDFFLNRGRERFGVYPFVRYHRLDIEREPQSQGIPRGAFDVVVATNVLHATRDLVETLAHTLSLLAPGGLLAVCEVTTHPSWQNVISTGLMEGWQRHEDFRRDHPLLSASEWLDLLARQGFVDAVALPRSGSPAGILGQHVLIARKSPAALDAVDVELLAQPATDRPTEAATAPAAAVDLRALLARAPAANRREIMTEFALTEVVRILRIDRAHADPAQRLMELGIDSLMALELRSRLASGLALERPLPATLVFDYPTVEAVADYLLGDVLELELDRAPEPDEDAAVSATVGDLRDISDEEVEALLMKKLQAL